jgi:hypothetical protein
MKTQKTLNIKIIFFLMLSSISFAQQIDIENKYKSGFKNLEGAHYKDLNSILNNFEGEWLYSVTNPNGTITTLLLKTKKVSDVFDTYEPDNIHYFSDVLLISHKLVVNGLIKFDNLGAFDQMNTVESTKFFGDFILDPNENPVCNSCSANEKRVELIYIEPNNNDYYYNIVLRRTTNSNNIPVLQMKVYAHAISMITPDNPVKKNMDLRVGDYILIKQP